VPQGWLVVERGAAVASDVGVADRGTRAKSGARINQMTRKSSGSADEHFGNEGHASRFTLVIFYKGISCFAFHIYELKFMFYFCSFILFFACFIATCLVYALFLFPLFGYYEWRGHL
jgi:hypothetical protein